MTRDVVDFKYFLSKILRNGYISFWQTCLVIRKYHSIVFIRFLKKAKSDSN